MPAMRSILRISVQRISDAKHSYEYCQEEELEVYLPEGRGESGAKQRDSETIESRDCRLEIAGKTKRLICPGGQVMETTEAKKGCGRYFYRFYPEKEHCQGCSVRERCYKNIHRQKQFSVKKEYFDALYLRKQMSKRLSSQKGKQRMVDRSCIVEHVFGEIKETYKFRRFV